MFGLVLVSDGQNEGPLNNGSDIYYSACSPLVWDNLGFISWQRWDSVVSSPVQRDSEVTREDRSLTYYSVWCSVSVVLAYRCYMLHAFI